MQGYKIGVKTLIRRESLEKSTLTGRRSHGLTYPCIAPGQRLFAVRLPKEIGFVGSRPEAASEDRQLRGEPLNLLSRLITLARSVMLRRLLEFSENA